jgi:hypothetical protein
MTYPAQICVSGAPARATKCKHVVLGIQSI